MLYIGQIVCNSTVNTNTTQINMGIQAKGVYLYKVLSENGAVISSGKFIIE
ncbi:MAG: T9SS type A sorting domain-containing protein [Bacteroidia bacterium]